MAGTEAAAPPKDLASWLAQRQADGTRVMYKAIAKRFLESALAKPPGGWEPQPILDEWAARVWAGGAGELERGGRVGWDLAGYAAKLRDAGRQFGTINKCVAVAKALGEFVAQADVPRWQLRQLRASYRTLRQARRPPTVLAPAQLRSTLAWLTPGARAFALTMASSGGRPFEVAGLGILDINRAESPWAVTFESTKERGARTSFVCKEAEEAIAEATAGRDFSASPRVFLSLGPDVRSRLGRMRREWRYALAQVGGLDLAVDSRGKMAFRLQSLRRYWKVQFSPLLGREFAEMLLGHSTGAVESAYQAYSVGQLRAAYAGALSAGAMWGRKGDEANMI